jgi:hypothetical protein
MEPKAGALEKLESIICIKPNDHQLAGGLRSIGILEMDEAAVLPL